MIRLSFGAVLVAAAIAFGMPQQALAEVLTARALGTFSAWSPDHQHAALNGTPATLRFAIDDTDPIRRHTTGHWSHVSGSWELDFNGSSWSGSFLDGTWLWDGASGEIQYSLPFMEIYDVWNPALFGTIGTADFSGSYHVPQLNFSYGRIRFSEVVFNDPLDGSTLAANTVFVPALVPEPDTYALMLVGLGLLGIARSRANRRRALEA